MRLPWPFGRAQRSASADGGAASGGGSAPVETPSKDAWRGLPPLAETVGPPPLVAPNRPFAAALASSEPPAPILAPLSHGRSLEAPRGLVSGIARATSTVAGPPLPAPVQRSPLAGRHAGGGHADEPGWFEVAAPEHQPPAPVPVASHDAGPEPPPAPIRHLAAVATAAPIRTSLTHAPESARPAPPVGLVGQPRASAAGRSPLAPPSVGVQRSPAMAAASPLPPASALAPAPSAAAVPAMALPAAPAPALAALPAAPRLTVGQVRRRGLGAPVAGGPISSATSSTSATASGASARSSVVGPGIQRAPEPDAPEMPLASRSAPGPAAEAAPAGPDGESMAPIALDPAPTTAGPARPITQGIQRAPAPGSPIVSAQPLRARVQRAPLTLQRAAGEPDEGGSTTGTAAPTASTGPVKVHRDSTASQLSSALDARSFTHGGEIFLPANHGPLSSGTGKALLAHELTHVTQQRRLGSSLPPEHSSVGRSLEAEAVAAERAPDMPLAHLTGGPATAPDPAGAAPAQVQRAPEGIQTLGQVSSMKASSASADAAAPAGDTSGGSGTKAPRSGGRSGHGHTEQELEVLAHQLYHRIGRHLRRELLVDRERIGFALDLP